MRQARKASLTSNSECFKKNFAVSSAIHYCSHNISAAPKMENGNARSVWMGNHVSLLILT